MIDVEAGGHGPCRRGPIAPVVSALCDANSDLLHGRRRKLGRRALPSRDAVARIVSDLRAALFPWHFGTGDVSEEGLAYFIGSTLDRAMATLEEQVKVGLLFECAHGTDGPCAVCQDDAVAIVARFAESLPKVRKLLGSDAQAAFDGDPAATSPDEAVFCYAGFTAIVHHRLAHELFLLGVPLIPRIIAELAHGTTGVDIHPGARIGESFFIDHGTGVVIGETCEIGDRVRLYQGVTLGAKSFPLDADGHPIKGLPRHPIVEDDVIIYAGATILGRITIGKGSRIGGNVWLTNAVPPHSNVSQAQARQQQFTGGDGI